MPDYRQTGSSKIQMRRILKSIKLISLGLAAIVILLLIALLLLAFTEKGSRWLIQSAVSNVKKISIAEINGTLANDLTLRQLHYQENNGFSVSINEFKLEWHATELLQGHLHISLLQLDGIEIKGQPPSSKDKENPHKIPTMPLSASIDALLINQVNWLNGKDKTEIQTLSLTAQLQQNTLTLSKLTLAMPQLQVNAHSEIQLQSDWPLTADFDWSYTPDKSMLNGQLKVSGNMDHYALNSIIKGAADSEQKGFLKLSADHPEFNLSGHWDKLQWPLSGQTQVSSEQGYFQIQGTAQSYQTRLNGKLTSKDTADFSINFIGHGNQEGINIEHFQLKPLQGQLSLNGLISWTQGVTFNLSLFSKQLNPADFGSDIPGKIDINAHSKGKIDGGKISAELDIKRLAGTIQNQPINAHGKIKLANRHVTIQQLQIDAGSNQLQATGQLTDQQADLDLTIAAPDLKTAWPSLAGNLNGTVQIRGSLLKPIIIGNLQGYKLRYENSQITRLSLHINYAHASQKQSKLTFSASDIQVTENKIKRITLEGYGNQANHRTRFEILSPLANASINANGHWDAKQWTGQISHIALDHPQ